MTAPRVELRTVQVFLVLAEELHFARTAERVGLTASRVSQTIRSLERDVGGALFARTSRRVALSPLGARLRDDLAPLYAGIDRALATAREQASGVVGEVRVGSYALFNFGATFTETIRAFEDAHPRATVRQVDLGMTHRPLEALRAREVDALAMRLPLDEPDVVVGPTLTLEPRVLVLARDHPLADRESVSYEDVGDYAVNGWEWSPPELLEEFMPRRTPSGRAIPQVACETFFDVIALIVSGRIVHPTIPSFVEYTGHPRITSVPIRDLPDSRSALVWLADRPTPGVLALAEIVERLGRS